MKLLSDGGDDDRLVFTESIGPGMPFFYRTPDLVAYANDGEPLPLRSRRRKWSGL